MENEETDRSIGTEDVFDELFNKHLKPLKSKNARKIFNIIIMHSGNSPLTTLDIQDKLDIFETKLDKKEINGWLSSLQIAGLISKEEHRGKPTTIKYDDKYTFDLWRLTDTGTRIGKKLQLLLKAEPSFLADNPVKILEDITQEGSVTKELILERLQELYIITKALNVLHKADRGLTQTEFYERLKLSQMDVEKAVLNSSEGIQPLVIKRILKKGIRESLLQIFGISGNVEFSLSEEGRKLARELSFDARVG